MDASVISKILRRTYFIQLVSAVILVGIAYLLKYYSNLSNTVPIVGTNINITVASLAGIVGIAAPIFYRSYFVHKIRDQKVISFDRFVHFEKSSLSIALITPYFLIVSLLLNMTENTNIIVALLALYAAYYYYPSKKRIQFEMKIFRMKPSQNID